MLALPCSRILLFLNLSYMLLFTQVRDRAIFFVNLLEEKQKQLNSAYILNGLQVSIIGLEKALHQFTLEPSESPFDLKTVPLATQPITAEPKKVHAEVPAASKTTDKITATRQDIFAEQLSGIAQFDSLGSLFKSSSLPLELTESETEYVVQCVKHTFANHAVFQFDCTNTLNDQVLVNAHVEMEPPEEFEVVCQVPCPKLKYNVPGTTYTCVKLPDDPTSVTGTFTNTLKFTVKDCDPNTGEEDEEGYEDEYVLEDIEVAVADHVQKVMKPNFAAAWEELGDENEMEDTFALSSMSSLTEAVKNIVTFLGLQPCERSDKVPEEKSSHTLYLAGVFRGGHDVLVRAKLALADGVTMQLCVRSMDPSVSEVIVSAVG